MAASPRSTRSRGREAERKARLHYLLRGYRLLDANAWAGGYELDLVLRRGRKIVFVEVKAKGGSGYGDPLEMIGAEKSRRLHQAAESWLAAHPECAAFEVRLEAVGIREGRIQRVVLVP